MRRAAARLALALSLALAVCTSTSVVLVAPAEASASWSSSSLTLSVPACSDPTADYASGDPSGSGESLGCLRVMAHDESAQRTELLVLGCLLVFLTSAGLVLKIVR